MNETTTSLINKIVIETLTKIPEVKVNPEGDEIHALGFAYNNQPFNVTLRGDNKVLQMHPVFHLNTDALVDMKVFNLINDTVKSATTKVKTILNYDFRANKLLKDGESYHIEEKDGEFITVITHDDYIKFLHPDLTFHVTPNNEFVIDEVKADFYHEIEIFKRNDGKE